MTKQLRVGLALAAALALPARAFAQADVVEYYHLDALGNVMAVSNAAGAEIESHDYLPFGEEWCGSAVCGAVKPGQPKRFTGKERDAETGLDYFGARYYRANVGRFTTIDPVFTWQENLVDPQRWNRYSYVRNNPLRHVDPDGRAIETLWDIGNVIYDIYSGWKTGNWTDLKADLAATAIPFLPAGASKLRHLDEVADAARTRLKANKAAGEAFEDVVAAQKSAEQTGVVRQLTVRAESGVRTKIDVAGRDAAGNVRLTEAKSSATARLTRNQRKAFPEIERTGGTVAGRGKPGLEGGTKIPPTTVEVCRPNCR